MFRLQHIMVQEGDVCPRSDGDDKNPVRTSRHSSKPMQGGRGKGLFGDDDAWRN